MKLLMKSKRLRALATPNEFYTVVLLLFSMGIAWGQGVTETASANKNAPCPTNPDPLYVREKTLLHFADMLNDSIPEYRKYFPRGFRLIGGRPNAFFVYDLSDPLNNKANPYGCVNLLDHHIYHISPYEERYSFSHIVVLEGGRMKIFRSINCPNRGDSLVDVLSYAEKMLAKNSDKSEILDRVRRYREFGAYSFIDDHSLLCDYENSPK
jgi:hypothetical protein